MRGMTNSKLKQITLSMASLSLVVGAVAVPPPLPSYEAEARNGRFKDTCKDIRKPFRKIRNKKWESALTGGLLGAIAGGIVGAMTSRTETVRDSRGRVVRQRRSNNVLEGILIGGAIGAGAGYLSSVEGARNDRAAMQKALTEHHENRTQYSRLAQQLADLGNCRNEQLYQIALDVESGAISTKEANKRLEKVDRWIEEDDEAISEAAGKDSESVLAYAQTVAVIEGETAEEVEAQGGDVLDRYSGDAEDMKGTVLVSYGEEELSLEDVEAAPVEGAGPVVAGGPVLDDAPPQIEPEPQLAEAFISSRSGARLRDAPSTNSNIVMTIAYRASVQVGESDVQGWSYVEHAGNTGYTASRLISDSRPAAVAKAPPRKRAKPKPSTAPGKITLEQKQRSNRTPKAAVSSTIAMSADIRAADRARKASNKQQRADTSRRIAAAVAAAGS